MSHYFSRTGFIPKVYTRSPMRSVGRGSPAWLQGRCRNSCSTASADWPKSSPTYCVDWIQCTLTRSPI